MKRQHVFVIIGIALALIAALLFIIPLSGLFKPDTTQYAPQSNSFAPTTSPSTTTTSARQETVLAQPYVSPVNFEELKKINSDIYAWITIPGTEHVNYPVVQSPDDDLFYLDHDSDKKYNINGAIFSEHIYNSTDFRDNVTVLYGHNMKSGEMFGDFQSLYWDEEFLRENNEIIIYLPDREIHFEIFGALPYSRMHLLHYYHTEKERAFELLIDDIYSTRSVSGVLLDDKRPEFGDQVLVLSTCLSGDNHYRYLLLGVCKNSQ